MITIKNLKKIYNSRTILDIESLVIEDGQKIAIMGKNGAGKTTLAEIIMGIIKPTSGEVVISKDLDRLNAVFQETEFSDVLSLQDVANFYKEIFKSDKNTDELFTKYEIDGLQKSKFKKLSGGQKQKFKFLIGNLNDPNLLLLDELATGLDYEWRINIINILKKELQRDDTTLVLISHELREVAALADRVIVLKQGVIEKDFQITKDFKNNIELLEKELGWKNEVNL